MTNKWDYDKLTNSLDELYSQYPLEYNTEREEKWNETLVVAGWTEDEFLKEMENRIEIKLGYK